ncbi:MAG: DUF3343 domain-containing protein [Syntrophales bacterium]|jgi:hypothetical protein
MNGKSVYQVILFPSVSHALKAEKILKACGISHKLIPIPRHISSDCGICLRFAPEDRDAIEKALQNISDVIEIREL